MPELPTEIIETFYAPALPDGDQETSNDHRSPYERQVLLEQGLTFEDGKMIRTVILPDGEEAIFEVDIATWLAGCDLARKREEQ